MIRLVYQNKRKHDVVSLKYNGGLMIGTKKTNDVRNGHFTENRI